MRKIFLVLAALALVPIAGRADTAYLYWQVNQDSSSADAVQFEFARVSVLNADGTELSSPVYLSQPSDPNTTLIVASSDGYNTGSSVASMLVGSTDYNSSDYSFVVELLSYGLYSAPATFDVVGRSAPMSYEAIQSSIAYGGTGLPSIEGSITPTSITRVVPEPTSALLFLVGGALLALRRKRRV